MHQSIDLMRAALGAHGSGDNPLALLQAAKARAIDPLVYCVTQLGLCEADVHQRAAEWCGLQFSAAVPAGGIADNPGKLKELHTVTGVRVAGGLKEGIYGALSFDQFMKLRERVRAQPELAERICAVPPRALRSGLSAFSSADLITNATERLASRWSSASGHGELRLDARLVFAVALIMIVALVAIAPFGMQPVLAPLAAIFVGIPAAFRLFAACAAPRTDPFGTVHALPDAELPIYSVLVPLHDEAHMVPQLAEALRAIDYPPEKLHVKFVVEETSAETVSAVAAELDDPRFELFVVPDATPRTKPKALNYVLPMVRGEFVVIYDAEDLPEPDQLRRAANVFLAEPGIDCLQCELVVDNGRETWLTAQHAAEYAGQFGVMLPTLARFGLPIPLGGNSNHFRTRALREVGGWDAFNVTEDADLGARLARLRYRTATLTSKTFEESPVNIRVWLNQRTRWLKGWMQTFIVHNRHPVRFLSDMGLRNFLVFQVYVGGLIAAGPLHTAFLVALAVRFALGGAFNHADQGWVALYALILLLGYLGNGVLAVQGLRRIGRGHLIPYLLLLPGYWVLTSAASMKALEELLTRPYFWAKTRHCPRRQDERNASYRTS